MQKLILLTARLHQSPIKGTGWFRGIQIVRVGTNRRCLVRSNEHNIVSGRITKEHIVTSLRLIGRNMRKGPGLVKCPSGPV